jgi:hypothetical protein
LLTQLLKIFFAHGFGDRSLIGLQGCGGEGERDLAQSELEQAIATA